MKKKKEYQKTRGTKAKAIRVVLSLVFFFFLFSSGTNAAPQIEISATLLDQAGKKALDGNYSVRFALYAQDRTTPDPYPSNSDPILWQESQNLTIRGGLLSTELGKETPLPTNLNLGDKDYYLGIRIGENSEMIPRKRINALPLALSAILSQNSLNADKLQNTTIGTSSGQLATLSTSGQWDTTLIPKIKKVGVITTGTWEAEPIESNYIADTLEDKTYNGLTVTTTSDSFTLSTNSQNELTLTNGELSYTGIGSSGTIAYSNGINLSYTSPGQSGQVLLSQGSGAPIWSSLSGGAIVPDSLDFSELRDELTLDANLSILSSANNYSLNFDEGTMFIDTANNRVGIGTTGPTYKFEVNGQGYFSDTLYVRNSESDWLPSIRSTGDMVLRSGDDFIFQTGSTGSEQMFFTDGAGNTKAYMYLEGEGSLAVGGASGNIANKRLYSYISSTAVTSSMYNGYFENLATNASTDGINKYGLYITSSGNFLGGAGTATNNYGLYIATPSGADNNYAAIFEGGNVGIGTTAPDSKLSILGAATSPQLKLAVDSSNYQTFTIQSDGSLHIAQDGGSALLALANGNVGIGTTSPGYKLDVNGSLNASSIYLAGSALVNSPFQSTALYGNTWTAKDSNRNWISVAMSSDGAKQTAVVDGGQIYVSTDSGNTWTAKDSVRFWYAVAMSADGSKQTAVVGGNNDRIYVSTDSGNTWTAKDSVRSWYSVAMSADGSKQTAVVLSGQIYISTDSGNTWTAKDSNRTWNDVAMSADGTKQTAVDGSFVYVSTDSGNTWTAKGSFGQWFSVAMSSDGTKQTVVPLYGMIYVSTDSGNTWTTKDTSRQWRSVAMSADGTKQTAVANNGLIYVSTDSGNTWTAKDSSRQWRSVAMSADGSKQTALVTNGQIYISSAEKYIAQVDPTYSLGIGTTAPSRKLEIYGGDSADGYTRITGGESYSSILELYADQGDDNADKWDLISNASDNRFSIRNNTSNLLTILSTGNVGIGTTGLTQAFQVGNSDFSIDTTNHRIGIGTTLPGNTALYGLSGWENAKIHVYSSDNATNLIVSENPSSEHVAQAGFLAKTTAGKFIMAMNGGSYGGGTGVHLYSTANAPMMFSTNSTEKLRITAAGNVGIGTTSPGAKLEISGTDNKIRMRYDSGHYADLATDSMGYFGVTTSGSAADINVAGGTKGLRFDSVNQLYPWLGTNRPWQLVLTGLSLTNNNGVFWSSTTDAEGTKDVGVVRNSAGILKITDGSTGFGTLLVGNIGIGTTASGAPLDIVPPTDTDALTIRERNSSDIAVKVRGGITEGKLSIYRIGLEQHIIEGSNVIFNETGYGNADFHIKGDTGSSLFYADSYERAVGIGYQAADLVGTTAKLAIQGNVGIGTTAPGAKLDVADGTIRFWSPSTNGYMGIGKDSGTLRIGAFGSSGGGNSADIKFYVENTGSSPVHAWTIDTSRNLMSAGQNIGNITMGGTLFKIDSTYDNVAVQIGNDAFAAKLARPLWNSADLAISLAGNERIRFQSNGNVGIGTTSPGGKLQINTINNGDIPFMVVSHRSANSYVKIDEWATLNLAYSGNNFAALTFEGAAEGVLKLFDAGVERIHLDSDGDSWINSTTGNVGIGTTSPGAKLSVNGTGYFSDNVSLPYSKGLKLYTGNSAMYLRGQYSDPLVSGGNDETFYISNYDFTADSPLWAYDTGQVAIRLATRAEGETGIAFMTNSNQARPTTRMFIGTSGDVVQTGNLTVQGTGNTTIAGNVGIGTTANIVGKLTINSLAADGAGIYGNGLVFTNNTNGTGPWTHAGIWSDGSANYNGSLVFGTDGDATNNTTGIIEKMRITSGGNVGIGTTSPNAKLQVDGGVVVIGTGVAGSEKLRVYGNIYSTGSIEFGNFYLTSSSLRMINKAGDIWLNWATRDTSGSEAVINLSNVGTLSTSGNVGIGTTAPAEKLEVAGNIRVTGGSFIDDGTTLTVPDYVFEADYPRLSIEELEEYILNNKHLPNVPDMNDRKGWAKLTLQDRDMLLLEKIEETTLYTLENNKKLKTQEELLTALNNNNLTTTEKITLLGEELTNTTQELETNQEKINLTLAEQGNLLTELQEQMELLETQNKAIIDFALAFDLTKVILKDSLGNLNLGEGKITAKDIEVLGEFEAEKVTTEILAISSGETSGKSAILAGKNEVVIATPRASKNVKIYLTLTSSSFGKILYVSEKNILEQESFTVKIDGEAAEEDISFSWLIVE